MRLAAFLVTPSVSLLKRERRLGVVSPRSSVRSAFSCFCSLNPTSDFSSPFSVVTVLRAGSPHVWVGSAMFAGLRHLKCACLSTPSLPVAVLSWCFRSWVRMVGILELLFVGILVFPSCCGRFYSGFLSPWGEPSRCFFALSSYFWIFVFLFFRCRLWYLLVLGFYCIGFVECELHSLCFCVAMSGNAFCAPSVYALRAILTSPGVHWPFRIPSSCGLLWPFSMCLSFRSVVMCRVAFVGFCAHLACRLCALTAVSIHLV